MMQGREFQLANNKKTPATALTWARAGLPEQHEHQQQQGHHQLPTSVNCHLGT
jgi:hypothetical protein